MEVLINFIVVIISQCACISNHHVVHLQIVLSESFFYQYPFNKLGKELGNELGWWEVRKQESLNVLWGSQSRTPSGPWQCLWKSQSVPSEDQCRWQGWRQGWSTPSPPLLPRPAPPPQHTHTGSRLGLRASRLNTKACFSVQPPAKNISSKERV